MTLEEAVSIIEERVRVTEYVESSYVDCVDIEALRMAISALEKQIPKKPKVLIDTWLCPTCAEKVEYQTMFGDNVLYHGYYDFCPNCGQAIDWSE